MSSGRKPQTQPKASASTETGGARSKPTAAKKSGGTRPPFLPQQTPTLPTTTIALPVSAAVTEVNTAFPGLALPGSSQSPRAGTPAVPIAPTASTVASASSSSIVPPPSGHGTPRGQHDQGSEGGSTPSFSRSAKGKGRAANLEGPVVSSRGSSSMPPPPPPPSHYPGESSTLPQPATKKAPKPRKKKTANIQVEPVANANSKPATSLPFTPQPTPTISTSIAFPVSAAVTEVNVSFPGLALPGSSQSSRAGASTPAPASSSLTGRDQQAELASTPPVPRVDKGKGKAVDPEVPVASSSSSWNPSWDPSWDSLSMPPPPVPAKAYATSGSRKRKTSETIEGGAAAPAAKRVRKSTKQAATSNVAAVPSPAGARPSRARGPNPECLRQYPGPLRDWLRIPLSTPGSTGFKTPRLINLDTSFLRVGVSNLPYVPGNYYIQSFHGPALIGAVHSATKQGIILPGNWYYDPWTGAPWLVLLLPLKERASQGTPLRTASQTRPSRDIPRIVSFALSSVQEIRLADPALLNDMVRFQMDARYRGQKWTVLYWEWRFGNGLPHPSRMRTPIPEPNQHPPTHGGSSTTPTDSFEECGMPPLPRPQSAYDASANTDFAGGWPQEEGAASTSGAGADYTSTAASSSAGPSRTGDWQQSGGSFNNDTTSIPGQSYYSGYPSSDLAGTDSNIASGSGSGQSSYDYNSFLSTSSTDPLATSNITSGSGSGQSSYDYNSLPSTSSTDPLDSDETNFFKQFQDALGFSNESQQEQFDFFN